MQTSRPSFSPGFWIGWLVASVLVLGLVPTWVGYGAPVWEAERRFLALGLAGVQLAAGVIVAGAALRDRPVAPRWALAVVGALLGGVYLGLLVLDVTRYSRSVLLVGSGLVVLLTLLPVLWRRSRRATAVVGLAAVAAAAAVQVLGGPEGIERTLGLGETGDGRTGPTVHHEFLPSSYHTLRATYFDGFLPRDQMPGGAIAVVDDSYLVVERSGAAFRLRPTSGHDSMTVERLDLGVPLNLRDFSSATSDRESIERFRVTDVWAGTAGDSVTLLVSHHRWKADRECFVLRVSRLRTTLRELWRPRADGRVRWETFYETEPCLELKHARRGHLFAGHQSGGRLARLDDGRYLLTVGDHEFDGWNADTALSQRPSADYGKILVLDASGRSRVFTLGHRNPQGLHIDARGRIWSTEHGPEGGDELNRVRAGANYGWPHATLGTEYGMHRWPLTDTAGRELTGPVFAWNPSIGISNLVAVRDTLFPRWRGDLLVGSLKANRLYRTRIRDGHVVNAEPIEIGGRIRDLLEAPSGRIVMLLDRGTVVALSPADLSGDGAAVFAAECAGCHGNGGEASGGIGPSLSGVFRQRIGWREDYDYSAALESKHGRWTTENLDRFLADPRSFAPGTTMQWDGMDDPERRRALIAYLKGL